MVTHCSNPDCGKPLLYLREGRIFLFEVTNTSPGSERAVRLEHFWLCGPCSSQLFIEKDGPGSVRVVPKTKSRRPAPIAQDSLPLAS